MLSTSSLSPCGVSKGKQKDLYNSSGQGKIALLSLSMPPVSSREVRGGRVHDAGKVWSGKEEKSSQHTRNV